MRLPRPLALASLVALMVAAPASASTFAVNTTADGHDATPADGICAASGGACTLRAAVEEADSVAGLDTITVPAGTYSISGLSSLHMSKSTTINGAGAGATVIDGGGMNAPIFAISNGSVSLTGMTLTHGSAGIIDSGGELVADGIAVRDNHNSPATNPQGGGVAIGGGVDASIIHSSITGNVITATGGTLATGGGIAVLVGATVTITATTIADNVVETPATVGGVTMAGGGVFSTGTTTLRHVTLADNGFDNKGGGFSSGGNLYAHASSSGPFVIADSIVSGGKGADSGPNCAGKALTTQGQNLDSGTSCAFPAGAFNAADPKLGPLGDHGSGTLTEVPVLGSPVIDAAGCAAPPADQRGQITPVGPGCDIGAAELGNDLSVSLKTSAGSVTAGGVVAVVVHTRNAGVDDSPATTMTLTAPAGAVVQFVTSSAGTCTQAATITCSLGPLQRGLADDTTLVMQLPGAGTATTSASVAGALPEVASADNGASVDTTVTPATGPGPPGPGADTTPPVITLAKLSGKLTRRAGGRLRFTLSEAAKVSAVVRRLAPGHRSKAHCVAKGKGKACTRAITLGTVSGPSAPGAGTLRLPKKLRGKALPLAKVRITLTAKDAAGNVSKAVVVRGKIVRR